MVAGFYALGGLGTRQGLGTWAKEAGGLCGNPVRSYVQPVRRTPTVRSRTACSVAGWAGTGWGGGRPRMLVVPGGGSSALTPRRSPAWPGWRGSICPSRARPSGAARRHPGVRGADRGRRRRTSRRRTLPLMNVFRRRGDRRCRGMRRSPWPRAEDDRFAVPRILGRKHEPDDIDRLGWPVFWRAGTCPRKRSPPHLTDRGRGRRRHAFLYVDGERARGSPRTSTRRGESSARWPGVPVAVKDVFTYEGAPTTCGSVDPRGWIPVHVDGDPATLDAGLIPLGKTNMDEFAMGSRRRTPGTAPRTTHGTSTGSPAAPVVVRPRPWPRTRRLWLLARTPAAPSGSRPP